MTRRTKSPPAPDQTGLTLSKGVLSMSGTIILADLPKGTTALEDPLQTGVYIQSRTDKPAARLDLTIGRIPRLSRFVSCYRPNPWWTIPHFGTSVADIRIETMYLMGEIENGDCVLLLPILDRGFTSTLQGSPENTLHLIAESNDPATVTSSVTGLFVAVGRDPHQLMADAARSVTAWMKIGRLRKDKPVPSTNALLGWCTWNAFYQKVSHQNVRKGLASFARGGVMPRMMILDDGWLSTEKPAVNDGWLTAFEAAPDKFPKGLKATVDMAKGEFGLTHFITWHTLHGYWGGVSPAAFPGYHVVKQDRRFGPGMLQNHPECNTQCGAVIGVVAPDSVHRFYQDFYRFLRGQGVDGVKVDGQCSLEAAARGLGGRTELMRVYHEAMEGAAQVHFKGEITNCMSHSNEVVYQTPNSNLFRTACDFWPNDPGSHGNHLFVNAHVAFWMGEFIHPDWDMFQSGHPAGAYHAAARAISGGPVYVSDTPDGHDFDLLRKVSFSDGTVPLPQGIARPTRNSLFRNAMSEDILLSLYNHNIGSAVIGVFNTHYHAEASQRQIIHGTVSPSDLRGDALDEIGSGDDFIIYSHQTGTVSRCSRNEHQPVALSDQEFDIFSIVPVCHGFAPIGLADKFNSAGAIIHTESSTRQISLKLRDGGDLVIWCAHKPNTVTVTDKKTRFTFDRHSGLLRVEIRQNGPVTMAVSQ